MQFDIQDRRKVYSILESVGIEIPRYAVLDRDSPDPRNRMYRFMNELSSPQAFSGRNEMSYFFVSDELVESEDHVEVNGIIFNKPFVEVIRKLINNLQI